MGGDAQPLTGPDLERGVPSTSVVGGVLLRGHAAGEPVLITRCDGRIVAIGAKCPHYGGPLDEGLLVGSTIRCPWHHAAFDITTGALERPPALNGVACWHVQEADGIARVTGPAAAPVRRSTPPERPSSVVIVGGGAAGAHAAETLRAAGYDGPVTMLEAGPDAPYDRPNLSKDYLAGSAPEEWIPLRPRAFYAEQEIELRLGASAAALDTTHRRVLLRDGTHLEYGALLLATGAEPIRLPLADTGQQVYYLRSLGDSRRIIAAAKHARRAVVLGASFIGLEVAASLRSRGLDVTVVAPETAPLVRVLGSELGRFIRQLHEEHGVRFRLEHLAEQVGADSVTLTGGERIPADLVVAGVGVRPSLALAEQAGLAMDRGVLVNECLETSAPGVYAAGDIARWPDPRLGESIRVEHWVVAQRQARTAAKNMLGFRERFDAVPFFWSAHYDVTINYTGHAAGWDEIVISGSPEARDCSAEFRTAGRTLAVATIGRDRDSLAAEAAMEAQTLTLVQ